MALLFVANLGLWLAIYAPIQILLPRQAELLDKANKTFVFSVVTGVGAFVAMFCSESANYTTGQSLVIDGGANRSTF